jgi:UPF0755 protein
MNTSYPIPIPNAAPRRRWRRRLALLVAVLVVAGLGVEAAWVLVPPAALRAGPRTIEIPPQLGLAGIAQALAAAGVIRSQGAFMLLAVARGTHRSLKAGEYEIPRDASLLAVLQLIEIGKVKPHLVVLREGTTVRELARQLDAEGLATAPEVLRVAHSPVFAQTHGIQAAGVEGYLFPDTYQITRGLRVEEILGRMVQRFHEKIATPDTLGRARDRGLSLHELVTLASIVEKEAVIPEERAVIAGVFWNRLKRDMPLQADPTVAYAVGKDGRPPSREDLQIDHPFNTYRYRGLPPGPIGNPGRAAVEAALQPAPVGYLYFVSVDDRRHHFSATLDEHNEAVARYRQSRRSPAP